MANNPFYPIGMYFSRLFGWRPQNNQQWFQNSVYNNKTPVWIDYGQDYLKAVSDCPHLNVVVNRVADMLANGQWKCVEVGDEEKEIKNDEAVRLLNKPNPLQRGNEFLRQYAWNYCVYATEPIYKNTGMKGIGSGKIQALWNLPLWQAQIIPTGKLYDQVSLDAIIEGVRVWYTGQQITYNINDLIFNAQNIQQNLIGLSRIPALNKPISNIVGALQTRNIIIHDKGVIGILSATGKDDGSGVLPLNSNERLNIEQQFRADTDIYGDRSKVKISTANIKWNPMSYPVKDLMLFEEIEDDFAVIIGAYGLHRDIFPSVKGATFENQNEAVKSSYQNGIQPIADDLAMVMTEAFGYEGTGKKLILDFSWLPIMKEDELSEAQAKQTETMRRSQLYKDNIITREQYAEEEEVELVPQSNEPQNSSQANLRGLVGSVTGIAIINQYVATGFMNREAGIAVLMNVYGYDKATASSMITTTTVDATAVAPSTSIASEN